jgi:hypothetical protein
MDQIAEEMSITNERARQLVRGAELALASLPGIELLEQYLYTFFKLFCRNA